MDHLEGKTEQSILRDKHAIPGFRVEWDEILGAAVLIKAVTTMQATTFPACDIFHAIRAFDIPWLQKTHLLENRFVNNLDAQNPINYAASIDNLDAVHSLMPLYVGQPEALSLIDAAVSGNVAIAQIFVKAGANVFITDERGWTPLMEAATWGHLMFCHFLIDLGADVHVTLPDSQTTALSIAEDNGHSEVVEFLKEYAEAISA